MFFLSADQPLNSFRSATSISRDQEFPLIMRIPRIVTLCLILTVSLVANPLDLRAAGKRDVTQLGAPAVRWASQQSSTPTETAPPPLDATPVQPEYLPSAPADAPANSYYSAPTYAAPNSVSGSGGNLPGGPYGRVGSPYYYVPQTYDPVAGQFNSADPYTLHFGSGYYRSNEYGHHRFPYDSYRRPWYFPGHTSYNRDTNYPW